MKLQAPNPKERRLDPPTLFENEFCVSSDCYRKIYGLA